MLAQASSQGRFSMTQLQWRRGRAQQTLLNKDPAGLGSASAVLCLSVLSFLGDSSQIQGCCSSLVCHLGLEQLRWPCGSPQTSPKFLSSSFLSWAEVWSWTGLILSHSVLWVTPASVRSSGSVLDWGDHKCPERNVLCLYSAHWSCTWSLSKILISKKTSWSGGLGVYIFTEERETQTLSKTPLSF